MPSLGSRPKAARGLGWAEVRDSDKGSDWGEAAGGAWATAQELSKERGVWAWASGGDARRSITVLALMIPVFSRSRMEMGARF